MGGPNMHTILTKPDLQLVPWRPFISDTCIFMLLAQQYALHDYYHDNFLLEEEMLEPHQSM